jgi:hypothetical protein
VKREAAAGTFAYEATTFDPAQANWPDYRLLPGRPNRQSGCGAGLSACQSH